MKFTSIITALCMAFMAIISPISVNAQIENRGIVFIAENGNDNAVGSKDEPLATFQGAQKRVREMISSGQYTDGITVFVRKGTYNFEKGLKLEKADSGTENAPIVWRSYNDEKVLLTGGVSIPSTMFKKVTDNNILSRIVTESARDSIYCADLKQLGIKSVGDPYLVGSASYLYGIGETIAPQPKFPGMEVIYNGKAMTNARYPNNDFMYISKIIDPSWSHDDGPEGGFTKKFSFTVNEERLKYWQNVPENKILMMGYWMAGWTDQTIPVSSIDVNNKKITAAWSACWGAFDGIPFYVYDLLEELDAPGEIYLDRDNCVLYINPPGDIKKSDVKLSITEANLIEFNGANNITFKNFDITACRGSAFNIENGNNNKIIGCDISYTASIAIKINVGNNNTIRDCYIHDVDGGVDILKSGDIATLSPGNNYVVNNHFENFARITPAYIAAIKMRGVGDRAEHNKIHDCRHYAINFDGQNNVIQYNEIYDVLQSTDDAGAIYGGLAWTIRGTKINYNYLHDIYNSTIESDVGIFGIYGDGGVCDMSICGNIIENIGGSGILVNGGRDNRVINNYLINNKNPGIDLPATMVPIVDMFYDHHYPIVERHKEILDSPQWKEQFPEFFEMMEMPDEKKALPENNLLVNNVAFGSNVVTDRTNENVDTKQNISVKPEKAGFVDLKNRDYNLTEDSPIFKSLEGFKAIPFTRIGICNDRAIARVQEAVLMTVDSFNCMVNGKKSRIDENDLVVPFIEGDRTYVPLRFLSEKLGFEVEYNAGEIKITSTTMSLELTVGSLDAKLNGESIKLENPLIIKQDRTFVPLRQVSELLGKQVYWNNCGLIAVSDNAELFDEAGNTDEDIITYLNELIKSY